MNKKGFTIIELIVVIAIIAVLAAIVVTNVNGYVLKARDTRRIADLGQMQKALELYKIDNGDYPKPICASTDWCYSFNSSWDTLGTLLKNYISILPKDPINDSGGPWYVDPAKYSYVYHYSATNGKYDLVGRLESSSSPYRCGVRNYYFYWGVMNWCVAFGGTYSNQLYSPQ